MDELAQLMAKRVSLREEQLASIASAARWHGARALHVFGSLGRGTADGLSDIDAWLTFPDEAIGGVMRDRWRLFGAVGEVLIAHEMTPNRPPGGIYSLVLYASAAGPLQVDWYLAPRSTSRLDPSARAVFADVALPIGDLPRDAAAAHAVSLAERIDWLACMLFVAVKVIARSESREFLSFLAGAYRSVCEANAFSGISVTEPDSFDAVGAMLGQLQRVADNRQRRALNAIDAFQRDLDERLNDRPSRPCS